MKKVLILSDTHQYNEMFQNILEIHNDADIKIHCGDACVFKDDPIIKNFYVVMGNHDFAGFDHHKIISPFFITHGHLENIYYTLDNVIKLAKDNDCTIVCHGHTHIAFFDIIEGITIINPGSIMFNRGQLGFGTYVIAYLNDNNKLENVNFFHHITHENVSKQALSDGIETLKLFRFK